MAQRTLRRMRDKRLVLSSRAPDGSVIYALAEVGARELQPIGVKAATGKDLLRRFSSSHFRHRHIANDVAISGMTEGYRASTEREVSQGLWVGGKEGVAGKLPDVLLRNSSHAWWIEVERSKKKEYATLLAWIEAVRQDMATPAGPSLLGGKLVWAQVVFICRPAFRAKLCRDLVAAGWNETDIKKLLRFETSLYRFQDINFG